MASNQSFCECQKLDMDNPDTFKYCCQEKVNEGLWTMKQYVNTCMRQTKANPISEQEFERLTNLWNSRGFKYVINEKNGKITFI